MPAGTPCSGFLVTPPDEGVPVDRLDLAVHALAQLPDSAELHLPEGNGSRTPELDRLATAYGVEHRIRYGAVSDARRSVAPPIHSMAELMLAARNGSEVASCHQGRDDLFAGQRIVVVTNLPTHYRVPLLNRLSRRLAEAGARLLVLFTAAEPWSREYMAPEPIEFEHEFLRSRRAPIGTTDFPLDLEARLWRLRPTLVLVAGFSPAVAMRAALAARAAGAVYGVWSGAIAEAGSPQGVLRRRQRQALLRWADFGISYGHLSAEYLKELSPKLPVVHGRNTAPIPADPGPRADADGVVEVLAVAQAIPRKALDVAVGAFELLRDAPCRLTVIGGGTDLEALRSHARGLDNVRLLGAVPSDRTLRAYCDAEIFLFTSRSDVFGLVLVEAMGAGLATVVSSAPGAVADLAISDHNCIVLDGHQPEAWAAAIRGLVDAPERRQAMGREARQTILSRWTVDHAADAMAAGLRLGVLAGAARRQG